MALRALTVLASPSTLAGFSFVPEELACSALGTRRFFGLCTTAPFILAL
eukprot:CAMPEP_0194491794 /NCGR_PEP_ID=MMETSP0253-20130528/10558_1 /TAXON_ID=2966 /ORGANISM="Noctiluca scintillans" /LENGTH=48 /DNA_ID= /DNA_START= /DNA_END= /DNA_ORIENTATION=